MLELEADVNFIPLTNVPCDTTSSLQMEENFYELKVQYLEWVLWGHYPPRPLLCSQNNSGFSRKRCNGSIIETEDPDVQTHYARRNLFPNIGFESFFYCHLFAFFVTQYFRLFKITCLQFYRFPVVYIPGWQRLWTFRMILQSSYLLTYSLTFCHPANRAGNVENTLTFNLFLKKGVCKSAKRNHLKPWRK